MKSTPICTLMTLLLSLSSVQLQAANTGVNGFIGAGLTGGGEDLATVEVQYSGNNSSTNDRDISSGGLYSLTGGVIIQTPNPAIDVQASFGMHSDDVFAGGDSVSFTRWPLELLAFGKQGPHRLGGGISYHLNPELDLEDVNQPVYTFENALGWVAEYGYSLNGWGNKGLVIGARYMLIEYELETANNSPADNKPIDGSHVGINFNWLF